MAAELKKTTQLLWRRFLSTEAGADGLSYLVASIPHIAKGDPASVTFDAGRTEGWRESLAFIEDTLGGNSPKGEAELENPGLER